MIDRAILVEVLDDIRVPRIGPGWPRTRPDAVIGDQAYSNELTVHQRKGSAGGRPPAYDALTYKVRNVVERHFGLAKHWRAIATRYDNLAITYRATAVLGVVVAWLHK